VPADYKNAPFQDFTDAVAATCTSGGNHACGSTMSFNIINFQGFGAATTLYNGQSIFAAVDIFKPNDNTCGSCTGVVGLVGPITIASAPGPLAGAGLPGLVAACGGLLALARRRRQRTV
jgi:hypothetical protein